MGLSKRRWILGPALVLVGVWLLLDTRGIVDVSVLAVVPPAIVILYGLVTLLASGLQRIFWPGLIVLIAVTWLAAGLGYGPVGELVGTYWPVVIVLAGLSIVAKRR
ncbi:MAG: LiaF transmembrane domain-containing protein [Halococcoides sp.]